MQLFILSFALVAICVFLLSFNIIFRKDGKFPETEIGANKELRKRGLMCAKAEEKILWHKNRKGVATAASVQNSSCCSSCCCEE